MGVLTGGSAARLVQKWQARAGGEHDGCSLASGADTFVVQVGFADGTVAQIRGNTWFCQAVTTGTDQSIDGAWLVYDELVRALARDAAAGYPVATAAPPFHCPASPTTPPTLADGSSAADLAPGGMILDLPAVSGVLCRYTWRGSFVGRTPIGSKRADEIRVTAGSSFFRPVCCTQMAPRRWPQYVVALVDKTGTLRALSLTGRRLQVTLYRSQGPQLLGFAGGLLGRAVGRFLFL
ncbi:MAG: hypothetical protein ACRDPI_09915 [Nocardioidaceae bacterium]